MAITKRPVAVKANAISEFIGRAPDAAQDQLQEPERRKKETISLGVDPALLARMETLAGRWGMSRAAVMALAMVRLADSEGA